MAVITKQSIPTTKMFEFDPTDYPRITLGTPKPILKKKTPKPKLKKKPILRKPSGSNGLFALGCLVVTVGAIATIDKVAAFNTAVFLTSVGLTNK